MPKSIRFGHFILKRKKQPTHWGKLPLWSLVGPELNLDFLNANIKH